MSWRDRKDWSQKRKEHLPDEYLDEDYQPRRCVPTEHPPGSTAKIQQMRRRAEGGEVIFHAEDVTNEGVIGGAIGSTCKKNNKKW